MKKGKLVLDTTANLILILLAAVILVLFIYFLRDKIKEFLGVIFGVFR